MRWLVTGAAGYIGSHVIRGLLESQHEVVAFDDLSRGYRSRIGSTVPFIQGDIRDSDALLDALIDIDGVIHLAGVKSVSESEQEPMLYYDINAHGTLNLLRAMRYRNVRMLLFSSTASVYANSSKPLNENSAVAPESVYGRSKLMAEQIIRDCAQSFGIRFTILRYFNVGGCGFPGLNDTSRDNVIPAFLHELDNGRVPVIYGDDYETPDGTCIRDYVHVADIASAHIAAANSLVNGSLCDVYNVGTGQGTSVKEITGLVARICDESFSPVVMGRRPGDAAMSVADVTRIRRELGWSARFGMYDIVESARHFSGPLSS